MNQPTLPPVELRAFRLRLAASWGVIITSIAISSMRSFGWVFWVGFALSHFIRPDDGVRAKPLATRDGLLVLACIWLFGAGFFFTHDWEGWQRLGPIFEAIVLCAVSVLAVVAIRREVRLFRFGPSKSDATDQKPVLGEDLAPR